VCDLQLTTLGRATGRAFVVVAGGHSCAILNGPMSQANLQIARRAAELASARDWDALFELTDPDIEWRDQMHAPDVPEVVHGIEQVRGLIAQWDAAYDTFTVEALEYIDADPWVICVNRWHGEGKGSGLEVEVRSFDAFDVRDGKIVRSFGGYTSLAAVKHAIGSGDRS
jgi:ketosteroid isomerase-like protein